MWGCERMSSEAANEGGVRLRELTIRAGGRTVLRPTSLEFRRGRVHVVIGPSGAGKSLLLRALAGLLGPTRRDGITVQGQVLSAQDGPLQAVLVPQQGGLLLEFSPLDNVRFAAEHASGSHGPDAAELLTQLRVPLDRPTAALSGGEARRCAVARALAAHAPIVLYDEPTAGLDPVTAKDVARVIRDQHDRQPGATTIIVTHDYESFLSVADEVYVLDSARGELRRMASEDRDELVREIERIVQCGADETAGADDEVEPTPWLRRLAWPIAAVGLAGERVVLGLAQLLAWPVRIRWVIPLLRHDVRLLMGKGAIVYILTAGLIAGFVSTHFTFEHLPYRKVLEPFVVEDVLAGIGFTLFRVIVPVLTTILIAARCGAAAAADIAVKSHTGQIDALRTVGAAPERYLLTPLLWVLAVGSVLMGAIAYGAALVASLLTFCGRYPELGALFWSRWIHEQLATQHGGWSVASTWAAFKLATCGWLTGLIAYHCSHGPKRTEREVTGAVTRTVLLATLAALVVHVVTAMVEF